jgi:hypothetical protein
VLKPAETEGLLVACSYFDTLDTPDKRACVDRFRTRFKRPPGSPQRSTS